jgi:hypothetical protein
MCTSTKFHPRRKSSALQNPVHAGMRREGEGGGGGVGGRARWSAQRGRAACLSGAACAWRGAAAFRECHVAGCCLWPRARRAERATACVRERGGEYLPRMRRPPCVLIAAGLRFACRCRRMAPALIDRQSTQAQQPMTPSQPSYAPPQAQAPVQYMPQQMQPVRISPRQRRSGASSTRAGAPTGLAASLGRARGGVRCVRRVPRGDGAGRLEPRPSPHCACARAGSR